MKHPLFKSPTDKLSPSEEAAITQELANAYRQNEISEKQPNLKRIVQNVQKRIAKENPSQ